MNLKAIDSFISHINWKKLLFPVLYDLESIDSESDFNHIKINNWEIANDKSKYSELENELKQKEKISHKSEE